MSDLNDARKALIDIANISQDLAPSEKIAILRHVTRVESYLETSVAQKIENDHAASLANVDKCARVTHEGRLQLARIEATLHLVELKEQIARAVHNGNLPQDFYTICPLAAL